MATYPDSIGRQESVRPLTNRRVTVSDGGSVRSVGLGESSAVSIDIRHPLITAAEVSTLQSFYLNNRNTVNQITVQGVTYDVQFVSEYTITSVSAAFSNAAVTLVGNAQ